MKAEEMNTRHAFGATPGGETVEIVTLQRAGVTARVMTWGASLQDFRLEGVPHSLVLGAPDFAPYLDEMRYFGAIVGPVANRIAKGRAPLEGQEIALERNENGVTTLHGGTQGCGTQNWRILAHGETSCTLILTMLDGTGGLPGPVTLKVRYALEEDGALSLDIEAQAEQATFCNPAHHSYWTLDGSPNLHHHQLQVDADRYLPVDAEQIPTGAAASVADTEFDHREAAPVLRGETGLDHNFCLSDAPAPLREVCTLETEALRLSVATTEPGLQVYDGAGLSTGLGHHPHPYGTNAGLAIEPQRWPDAPNQNGYPSILLHPGETYRQTSRFKVTRK